MEQLEGDLCLGLSRPAARFSIGQCESPPFFFCGTVVGLRFTGFPTGFGARPLVCGAYWTADETVVSVVPSTD